MALIMAQLTSAALTSPVSPASLACSRALENRDDKRFEEAEQIYEAIGHPFNRAKVRANRGIVEEHMGNLGIAEKLISESISVFRDCGDSESVARNLPTLARIQAKSGRAEEAIQHCTESLAIREKLGNGPGIGESLMALGKVLVNAGRAERAIPILERARSVLQTLPWSKSRIEVLATLCEAYQDAGRGREFRDALKAVAGELRVFPREVRRGPLKRLLKGLVLRQRGVSTDWSSFDGLGE